MADGNLTKRGTTSVGTGGKATDADVAAFIREVSARPQVNTGGRGRLIFAMDATASREPTWQQAQRIQGDMFSEASRIGGLDVQLVYFRGLTECRASRWVADRDHLARLLGHVECEAGHTQIGRVLGHALVEAGAARVHALVFVGDCVEEPTDALLEQAGELGLRGVPVFMFHEGGEPGAAAIFKEIARRSGGAYCSFDASAAQALRDLLAAVAVFAVGGRRALADFARRQGGDVLRLTQQMP